MKKKIIITIAVLALSFTTYAQPGTIDLTFNPTDIGFENGNGTNEAVYTSSVQSDGKVIIGGNFTYFNGASRGRIVRLNVDGTLDNSFNSVGANNIIYTTSIQSDGKIIIGGDFTSYNGTAINRIARINIDGTLDLSFNPGIGANTNIRSTSVQSDGKIIIGGEFISYNGAAINRIARLNVDGTLDGSFNPGTGANSAVLNTSIQSDGKVIISGWFTFLNGTSRNRIARMNTDGTLDSSFNPGTGASDWVLTTSIQNNGKIIIGGDFTYYNSTARNRIARLNTDGTLDVSFDPVIGADITVYTTSIQSDGKIIIGGDFTSYNGTVRKGIARINTDGTLDNSFNPLGGATNPGGGANSSTVRTSSIQTNGKIIIGGSFTFYNITSRNQIALLNTDATLDLTFNPGTGADNIVYTTSIQSDGKIIVGGLFTVCNGAARNGICRLNVDGTLDLSFNPGTGVIYSAGPSSSVKTISIQSDGKIIIGGAFDNYNGTVRNGIARLNVDGSLDSTFNPVVITGGSIYTTCLQSDGKIIIGGWFTFNSSSSTNRIARLNSDGSFDGTFNVGTGANNVVETISIQSEGKIIIGGSFTTYNGTARNRIARLNGNGTLDFSFNPGSGASNTILTTSIQNDKKIIIGGSFTSFDGTARNRIARLNIDGTLDSTFNVGTGASTIVSTISLQIDEKIIIGGYFNTYNGNSRKGIARLDVDGTLDLTFNPGTGATNLSPINFSINSTSIQSDGKILIGGYFTSYNGTGRNRVARINGGVSLSNSNFEKRTVVIYPNPSNGVFHINTSNISGTKKIDIYTVLGKKIFSTSFSENESNIDLLGKTKGVYLYRVSNMDGDVKNGKLVLE